MEDLIREIIEETGYVRLLEEEDTEEANGRIENIEEFINKVVTYEENCEEEPTLSGFLEEVALVADIDTVDDDNTEAGIYISADDNAAKVDISVRQYIYRPMMGNHSGTVEVYEESESREGY